MLKMEKRTRVALVDEFDVAQAWDGEDVGVAEDGGGPSDDLLLTSRASEEDCGLVVGDGETDDLPNHDDG